MTNRTGIASDRVLFHHGMKPATVVVEDGMIVDIVDRLAPIGGHIEDVGDLVVMPALVDTNVHVSDPGRPEWEGFTTATAAAAAGGTAIIFDMPLEARPSTLTAADLAIKKAVTRGIIRVDVGFWGGLVHGSLPEIPLLADAGVFGFFAAFTDSGLGAADSITLREFEGALQTAARFDLPVLVDAESPDRLAGAPPAGNDHDSYLASRPVEAELEGIAAVIEAARRTRGWAHIVHLSTGEALPMLAAARRDGVRVTVETCPHYLTISAEDVPPSDPLFRCSPPLRSALDREQLWDGLVDGTIDMIVSDHSPCPPAFRETEYSRAWAGIASLELRLPLIWTEASRRGIGLRHVVRWLSEAPGALAQLPSGSIEPGRRADLVAWDPDAEFVVDPRRMHQRHPLSPYAGIPLRGVVHNTWVAGEMVFADRVLLPAAKGALLDLA